MPPASFETASQPQASHLPLCPSCTPVTAGRHLFLPPHLQTTDSTRPFDRVPVSVCQKFQNGARQILMSFAPPRTLFLPAGGWYLYSSHNYFPPPFHRPLSSPKKRYALPSCSATSLYELVIGGGGWGAFFLVCFGGVDFGLFECTIAPFS